MLERRRIHSTQLPRINRIVRLNTYEQRGTLLHMKRQISFHTNPLEILSKRSALFVVYMKDFKLETLNQLFYIPDEPELEDIQSYTCLEFLATIVCYLIKHDITISMNYSQKSRYIKLTQLHHEQWMKLITQPITEQVRQQIQQINQSLNVASLSIIKRNLDNGYLKDQLLEYIRIKNQYCCFKLITMKILPLLKPTPQDFYLPQNDETYNLVLDMDETILFYDQEVVHLRPFLLSFLKQMARIYDLILFTAGLESYAKRLLSSQVCKYFKNFLYRHHTLSLSDFYAKDLRRLGRPLSKTIIIDNTPQCFSFQPDNGIQIQTWRGDGKDTTLLTLIPILKTIRFNKQDIRIQLRQYKDYNGLIFPK